MCNGGGSLSIYALEVGVMSLEVLLTTFYYCILPVVFQSVIMSFKEMILLKTLLYN